MEKTIFFLLLFISSFTFGQTFTTVKPVLDAQHLMGYGSDSVLSISGGGYNGGTCLLPITTQHLPVDTINGNSFHSAVDDFKPKLDTVKIIVVYIDTTLSTYLDQNSYWHQSYDRLPIWDYAYSVRENYMGYNFLDRDEEGNVITGFAYLPTEQWRHKSYLNKYKKVFSSSTIIIQSIQIK